jgi:hypothetical protein
MFVKNVGTMDRALRIILGCALLAWGLWAPSFWGLLGFVPLATGLTRFCPAYVPLKLSTCRSK